MIAWLLSLALGAPQDASWKWTSGISSRAEFDRLARETDLPYRLSHVRFLIDRQHANRIYYFDSRDDRHHREFANHLYLSLEPEQTFFANNTTRGDRRFLLGWISYQTPIQSWTYEFWDGDQVTAPMIRLAHRVVNRSFFSPVAYKPNSTRQEEVSGTLDLPRVLLRDIVKRQSYQPLNLGFAIGRLRVLAKAEDALDAAPDDILVLPEAPASSPPVAGLVFAQPTTPLSHLGLLARGWKIPSATIQGAVEGLKKWNGQVVAYRTEAGEYHLHPAEPEQVRRWQERRTMRLEFATPKVNVAVVKLAELAEQRAADSVAYGAKSANLGEVLHAKLAGAEVPRGFTLPFSAYQAFVRANGLDKAIRELVQDEAALRDPAQRRIRLEGLRKQFAQAAMPATTRQELVSRARQAFGDKGVFVRSSTNSEDLPNFSGAGLYTTVPNVKGEAALIAAVQTVWGSVWNDEAYLARQRAGIPHDAVAMAVLIQEGVPSESSGVMITTNPFDTNDAGAVYISAKRGLGIRVVDGKRVPEQVVFHAGSNAVQVLTRSEEDSLLAFDPKGGVREEPSTPGRAVLSDALIRRLANLGLAIQRLFGNKPQDIEWAVVGDKIYILQSRPYVRM